LKTPFISVFYYKSRCFDPFPFPDPTAIHKTNIRNLAEHVDSHRKAAQARGATITGMYNLLAKLKAGEAFTPRERQQHEVAQTEILRQLHDELDVAVAEAYGWPVDLPEAEILERLVALNRERAAEEARGLVRWLRPEYQAPAAQPAAVPFVGMEAEVAAEVAAPIVVQPWPKELKAQLAVLRDLLVSTNRLWDLEAIATAFKSRGRYRESIATHLDLLADLGMVQRVDTPQGPRWCRAQALGA
jgi:phage I-like protein